MNIKISSFFCVALVYLVNAGVVCADSVNVMATLTADNHYVLYYGTEDANSLTYVGQNEVTDIGSSGGRAWTNPETWNFTTDRGDYLYVLGWSDDASAQGWIGEFNYNNGFDVFSNKKDWEYFSASRDLDPGYVWIDSNERTGLKNLIQSANSGIPQGWSAVQYSLPNGSSPWGLYSQISQDASWIWGTPLIGSGFSGEYFIFRTKIDPVPEPATMLLMGIGLAGLAGIRKRKRSH